MYKYVTLPFKMNRRDTKPLSRCSLSSKGASSFSFSFRFWVFSKIKLPSLFCIRHYTPHALLLKGVLNMHLLVAKDCIMKMFANFSEWDAVVVVASICCNNKTSEPNLDNRWTFFNKCLYSLLWYKYLWMTNGITDSFWKVGSYVCVCVWKQWGEPA